MTSIKVADYLSSGFFVLRTPLLPLEDFLMVSQCGADRPAARFRLREWLDRPEVREALWLASPELIESLAIWQEHPESDKGRKLERALYRYLARMTARSTPFGAFAGCTVGRIDGHTCLRLGPRRQYARHTRLSVEYLCGLAESVILDRELRRDIVLRPNTSLHFAAGRHHHLRGGTEQEFRPYQLVATESTPALEATLQRSAGGASGNALALALVDDSAGISGKDGESFIAQLVESQVLVADLRSPVTGSNPIDHMIAQLDRPATAAIAQGLIAMREELDHLDKRRLGAPLSAYDRISGVAGSFGEFRAGRLFHLDLIKPAVVAVLSEKLVGDILRAVSVLNSIQPALLQPSLEEFKTGFIERYHEREVPLLEALDDEAGLGFEAVDNTTPEPLLEGLDFQPTILGPAAAEEESAATAVLRRRLAEQTGPGMVMHLDEALLAQMRISNPPPLPDSFSVMGSCYEDKNGAPGFHLQNAAGPSGANLLARFCYGDEELAQCVQHHLDAEQALYADEVVFAEIAHLPEGRVGNVVCRPVLREYEIPFLATAGVPEERQIPLSDLTVSIRADRIVLRSRRLGREVIPRLTSAHNFVAPNSLKLYKFLCLLQHQGLAADVAWDWGALAESRFLPRVMAGNVVVALARWRLSVEEAGELRRGSDGIQDPLRHVQAWREDKGVRRFVNILDGDNRLLIDLESALAVEVFLEHLDKSPGAILEEMFPAPEALLVHGPEGRFMHEVIIPFVRKTPAITPAAREMDTSGVPDSAKTKLAFKAGSHWLFAKLYCSPTQADRVLLDAVQHLVHQTRSTGSVDRWFFVRYEDPHWHLRLRLRGEPAKLGKEVFPELMQAAEAQKRRGLLWKVEIADYEPEIERYGGAPGLEIAERIFELDSKLCLDLLPMVTDDSGAELRWQLALHGVDRLLSGLGLGLEARKKLMESMRQSREQQWVVDDSYRRSLAAKLREANVRRALSGIVSSEATTAIKTFPEAVQSSLIHYSAGLESVRDQLESVVYSGKLGVTLNEFAANCVHMQLNRILRSAHHQQEAVLCHLLARAYAERLARQ